MAEYRKNVVLMILFLYTVSASIYLQESKNVHGITEFSLNDEEDDIAQVFKKALKSNTKRSLFQTSASPLSPPSIAHPGSNHDVIAETVLKNDLGYRGSIAYLGDTNKVRQSGLSSFTVSKYLVAGMST